METRKTKGAHYADRRRYVEAVCAAFLEPMRGFGGIEYGRRYLTGEEFVKIYDVTGTAIFLDVTALSKAQIGADVCKTITKDVPTHMITDAAILHKIAPLFKGGTNGK